MTEQEMEWHEFTECLPAANRVVDIKCCDGMVTRNARLIYQECNGLISGYNWCSGENEDDLYRLFFFDESKWWRYVTGH